MAQTALSPTRIEAIGTMTKLVTGVAGGSGTSTVVTIPNVKSIKMVLVSSATSATGAFVATISGNTFTCTTASNDLFTYIAFCEGGI